MVTFYHPISILTQTVEWQDSQKLQQNLADLESYDQVKVKAFSP